MQYPQFLALEGSQISTLFLKTARCDPGVGQNVILDTLPLYIAINIYFMPYTLWIYKYTTDHAAYASLKQSHLCFTVLFLTVVEFQHLSRDEGTHYPNVSFLTSQPTCQSLFMSTE